MKDKHPIDDLFREGLSSRKLVAPASAWEAIENNIDQKSKKPRTVYLISAIAASICLLCAATWIVSENNSTPALNGQVHQVSKNSLAEIQLPSAKNIPMRLNITFKKQLPQQAQVLQRKFNTPDVAIAAKEEFISIGIQATNKKLLVSAFNDSELLLNKPQFTLPIHTVFEDAPKGMRSRFIRGVFSMAKGVYQGKETLSGLRKSKIEFIQDDLKYGSEKESEEEATIDEDSPSYQK